MVNHAISVAAVLKAGRCGDIYATATPAAASKELKEEEKVLRDAPTHSTPPLVPANRRFLRHRFIAYQNGRYIHRSTRERFLCAARGGGTHFSKKS